MSQISPETETLHHVPEIFLFYRNKIFHHAHTDCRVFEKWLEKSPWLYPPDQCEIVRYVPAIPGLAQRPDLEPLAWRWRTLPRYRETGEDDSWALTEKQPKFINPHHHEVEPLFASPDTSTDHQLVLSAWKIVGYDKSEKLCWVMRPEQLLAAIAVSSPLRGNTK